MIKKMIKSKKKKIFINKRFIKKKKKSPKSNKKVNKMIKLIQLLTMIKALKLHIKVNQHKIMSKT